MDPLLSADTDLMEREADTDARRKIQFSVPSPVPTQLDPRQVEMVRLHAENVGDGDGVRGGMGPNVGHTPVQGLPPMI